jgi:hypothetical protein
MSATDADAPSTDDTTPVDVPIDVPVDVPIDVPIDLDAIERDLAQIEAGLERLDQPDFDDPEHLDDPGTPAA